MSSQNPASVLAGRAITLFAAFLIGESASAAETINASQSKLYMSVDVRRVYSTTGWDADYSKRRFFIQVIPRSGADPQSEVFLSELAPGYFFPNIGDPASFRSYFNFFGGSGSLEGGTRKHVGTSEFDWVFVKHQNRECALFVDADGQGGGDGQTSDGTSFIAGYWCAPTNQSLSMQTIGTVFNAIGVKEAGNPAPASVSINGSRKSAVEQKSPETKKAPTPPLVGNDDPETRLLKAKSLLDKGLITQEDYDAIKQEILEKL